MGGHLHMGTGEPGTRRSELPFHVLLMPATWQKEEVIHEMASAGFSYPEKRPGFQKERY